MDSSATIEFSIVGQGGIRFAGTIKLVIFDQVDGTGGIELVSKHLLNIHKIIHIEGGTLIFGGDHDASLNLRFEITGRSADTPPDFSSFSVGYNNWERPTTSNLRWFFDLIAPWQHTVEIIKDVEIPWNTGPTPMYFYRIVGKQRNVDICDPLQVGEECCRQFIMNIPARNITDLCEKMRQRRWKWPVLLVQKFSRPAENVPGLDFDPNCDILENIEICNNIVCQDFCIDFDVEDQWGAISSMQYNAFLKYASQGGAIVLGSESIYDYSGDKHRYTSSGQLIVSGESVVYVPYVAMQGGIGLSGQAQSQFSRWNYLGGDSYFSTHNLFPTITDQYILEVSDRNWIDINHILREDDLHAIVDTSDLGRSKFIVVEGFNFNIPTDAAILGIEVSINRHSTGVVHDREIYLVVHDEILSDNLATNEALWPLGTDELAVYGGSTNIWRDPEDDLGAWDIEDINDPGFGVAIRVGGLLSQPVSTALINSVRVKIYWFDSSAILHIAGEAGVVSPSYHWDSLNIRAINGSLLSLRKGNNYRSIGRGTMGPMFSSFTVGGHYITHFSYQSLDNPITVAGSAIFRNDMVFNGVAYVVSSRYLYESSGELFIAGTYIEKNSWNINGSGGTIIGGDTGINNHFRDTSEGSLSIHGVVRCRSSAFKFVSDGNVLFIGLNTDTQYRSSDLGIVVDQFGYTDVVQDVLIRFSEEIVVEDTLPIESVTECLCNNMRLIMPMTHNIDNNNKLSQFLLKNNFALNRQLDMRYNHINDAWIYNQIFEGKSANGQPETWTIVFQLQCTNLVAGLEIENNIWRFSIQIIQKNLITKADYDTRIVIGFLPNLVCENGFKINLSFNVQNETVNLNPATMLYEYIYHDNINLFNNAYWIRNPNLNFELSQVGIDKLTNRHVLSI